MAELHRAIIVAGDITNDWITVEVPPAEPAAADAGRYANWQLYAGTRLTPHGGGALLLARMIGLAASSPVITHRADNAQTSAAANSLQSFAEVAPFPLSSDKKNAKNFVYRVKRFRGYSGPPDGRLAIPGVEGDAASAAIVVLDDAGNGFRDEPEAWPAALRKESKDLVVVHKMSRPLAAGKLWQALRKRHASQLVVLVSADDLRAQGVQVSRRLSWERTATDFIWQLASNPALMDMANCTNLVVRFGLDGAIHYRRGAERVEARLYYDPAVAEDGFRDDCPGDMVGLGSAFAAAIVGRIAREGLDAVGEGVRDGLRSARRQLRAGFGTDPLHLDCIGAGIFDPQIRKDELLTDAVVPNPTVPEPADPTFWCILRDLRGACLEDIAYDVVRHGSTSSLKGVPVGRFGNLRTVDRAEIESFRSIRNLIREYVANVEASRPLSIAVFGPPGSGKSFGVTEVAESVAPGSIRKVEFNVSQFTSPGDLVGALHRVRDEALGGRIPLVFFDEFDSRFEGALGWLKYFLAPMQDGKFRDGEALHPIGRAIFVFAGGTSSTFDEFRTGGSQGDAGSFRAAKGDDFVSRLRGYVNILGPNPSGESDNLFMIRRAMLLRSLLERKARNLVSGDGRVRIDEGVLRAMIKVPLYKHGVRSMEALIDMSMLAGQKSFEQASLPPALQMQLHVDAEKFCLLVVRDVIFGAARELMAKAIHEKFREDQKNIKTPDDPAMLPWEELLEPFKESNRQQADHIPSKLRRIGCGFGPPQGQQPVVVKFTKEEIEILAEMEHDRYVAERRLAGFTLGKDRSVQKKTSPYLVPWSELSDDVKKWDRQTVEAIPELVARAGFEIYRLT
jgi:hypothetical protein